LEPFAELTLERLREGPVLAPDHQEVAFSDFVFPTPSGKIELESVEAIERWGVDAVPTYGEPAESITLGEPSTSDYPLYMLTPNTKNRIHSQFNNLKMIRQFGDTPFAYIHPDDASARGISEGDRVRIFNARGQLELEARLDNGLKAGCVCVTNGWWISEGGTVNFTSAARETDMGYGAAFHDNRVQVEAVKRAE
jgi:anaerobic selenocysteine-containing dehydrogenase